MVSYASRCSEDDISDVAVRGAWYMIGLFVVYSIHPYYERYEEVTSLPFTDSWFYRTQPIILLEETET